MRIVLADLRGKHGFVSKDTVAGGFGARLEPFSAVTRLMCVVKRRFHDVPSVQMAGLAAILAEQGHEVVYTRDRQREGDVALVLTSLVDHRQESAWAREARTRGLLVGMLGVAASMKPELFLDDADFLVRGEPEEAILRLASGESLSGIVESPPIQDLDILPFPRWDLLGVVDIRKTHGARCGRPRGGGLPVLASRGCPESCSYCPHRILAPYRRRSVANIADELEGLTRLFHVPHVIFRDPNFTADRERCMELCEEILSRGLKLHFECETRLDRLDSRLLDRLCKAGLRVISFGIESVSPEILRNVGRRAVPEEHQKAILQECRRLGVATSAYFVAGFPEDTWESVTATIRYALALDPTYMQFKMLTPYPGTPFWDRIRDEIFETDWERFNGYNLTFRHSNLAERELRILLGASYARFYARPSFLTHLFRIPRGPLR